MIYLKRRKFHESMIFINFAFHQILKENFKFFLIELKGWTRKTLFLNLFFKIIWFRWNLILGFLPNFLPLRYIGSLWLIPLFSTVGFTAVCWIGMRCCITMLIEMDTNIINDVLRPIRTVFLIRELIFIWTFFCLLP